MVKTVRKEPEWAQVKIRIPYGLKKRLARESELRRHSLNAEITHRLEFSFQVESRESLEARLLKLEGTVTSFVGTIAKDPDDK